MQWRNLKISNKTECWMVTHQSITVYLLCYYCVGQTDRGWAKETTYRVYYMSTQLHQRTKRFKREGDLFFTVLMSGRQTGFSAVVHYNRRPLSLTVTFTSVSQAVFLP